jgi:hypothetical protein
MTDPIVVKAYSGNGAVAARQFQEDASEMAAEGYQPVSQIWLPGAHDSGSVLFAVILCLFGIGIFFVLYMLLSKPDGTLAVTYSLRTG